MHCELLAGCSSFAFQINCACFSLDNVVGEKVVSVSQIVNKGVLKCVFLQIHILQIVVMLHENYDCISKLINDNK